jgi:hypothetical protein
VDHFVRSSFPLRLKLVLLPEIRSSNLHGKDSACTERQNRTEFPDVATSQMRSAQAKRDVLWADVCFLVNSGAVKWNRADSRVCAAGAQTFSHSCVLEKATDPASGWAVADTIVLSGVKEPACH